MKKLMMLTICLILSGAVATYAQETKAEINATSDAGIMAFNELVHDYGEVPEGPMAEYDFVFKNKGKKPIVINKAVGSCGCTVAAWDHEPVLPGKKGKIHVTYNTLQRPGPISKQVTVMSDASEPVIVLQIKGNVKFKVMGMVTNK
ncbi:DUF1573 domain-containing protein [Flavipsychrobacter stenotrophus]|uniref:DUF1573 domain-containing protein n=1 Tax=Flavipsychrobacter stenotrophus TaxID=2077091 RepID=A0A2S7STF0_9BACT|nr:DUF1573 domain-containing protein [Flavipsychrobacter stenotrophus]PQJ09978.1 DUF1573 domain-containing protein [Flavipsychrobacter stenotrophus]